MCNNLSEVKSLKWIPWIGDEFNSKTNEKNRLLIIGESHYKDEKEGSFEECSEPTFTKNVVKDIGINKNYYRTKLFQNLHLSFFCRDDFNTSIFWRNVAFYNFIQELMDSSKHRPNETDIMNGWQTFFKIINIIEPTVCLFLGTSSSNYLMKASENSNFSVSLTKEKEKISGAYPRIAILKNSEQKELKLIFIQHPSSRFSWGKWHNFLNESMPNEIEYLKSKVFY